MSLRPPLAAVYGGGGFFGIAYGLGVAHGLRAAGVDLTDAPALGTSAGSWVAAAMVRHIGYDDFAAMPAPSFPDRRRGLLAQLAADLFGPAGHPNVSAVAVRLRTGRRVVLDGSRAPLAVLCAASSAVPGVYAAHRVGRGLYVDGGVRSGASVDLGAAADHLVVIVPVGGPMLGGAGRGVDVLLRREIARWHQRHGSARVTVVRPNRAIAAKLGLNPRNLFDAERAKAVYPLAVAQGRRWAERILTPTDSARRLRSAAT